MKYYKITNKLEFHNGYQYKNGMNILPDIFNDDENVICGAGGFYFTTAEHIHNFYYLGENVRVIEIPKNKHCKVISTNNICRSNMIILKEKYNFNVPKDLIEILKINKNTLDIVNYFSLTNNVKMLKWLKSNNVFEYDEKTINYACFSGHVPVLNFMDCYDFKYDENAINYACFNGHVNVLEWFKHSKRPFIYTTWAISLACQNNHVHVLEWFKNSSYDFKYDENAIHNAAQYNNVAVLKWFKKNNYLIIFNDEYVLNHSNEKMITWFIEQSLLKM